MYGTDSFFTLSGSGRIGLVVVSLILSFAMILMVRAVAHRLPLFWRIAVAVVLFWAFVWLSPQVYYAYYRLIIEGLPSQIVVGTPPGIRQMVRLLMFSDNATLSFHGKAVLGWAMIAAAVLKMPRRSKLTSA